MYTRDQRAGLSMRGIPPRSGAWWQLTMFLGPRTDID